MPDLTYSGQIVRQQDPDMFLLSLLMPESARSALWALFAFRYEIAKTREVVTETTMGLIRLQWWRDGIADIYQGAPARQNEILPDLAQAISRYGLPQEDFDTVIYAHEFDLESKTPATLEGLRHYADFTVSPLVRSALKILGQTDTPEIIKQAAQDYACMKLLRAVPKHIAQSRSFLPDDLMLECGVSLQKILDFNHKENLPDVVSQVIKVFSPHRNAQSRFVKGMQILTDMHRRHVERYAYDVFHPGLTQPPPFMALRLWWGL